MRSPHEKMVPMTKQLTLLEAASLRKSLSAKLTAEAKKRGVAVNLIRKQYIFTIFLGRVFQDQDAPWILLGGNALLIRTGGGRFTQDIDLAREEPWPDIEQAREELQQLAARPYQDEDPFDFNFVSATVHSEPDAYGYGAETGKISVQATLGGVLFEPFNIDITTRRHVDSAVDQVALNAVIDHATLQDLPTVPTTPIENHLADKICALYEGYGADGNKVSTRYRDLADIVRIVAAIEFDAARLTVVLEREADRRRMTLPTEFIAPGDAWSTAFPNAAADFAEYPPQYRDLDAALNYVGSCLNEVLSGERTSGIWDPAQHWS